MRSHRLAAGLLLRLCVRSAAPVLLLPWSASAQSSGLHCGAGDDWSAMLLERVGLAVGTDDASYDRLRAALGIVRRSADSVVVVSDSITCARAVTAVDRELVLRRPGFVPLPVSGRVLYVARIGYRQHVAWDADPRLVTGSYSTLWWFGDDFGRLLATSTY